MALGIRHILETIYCIWEDVCRYCVLFVMGLEHPQTVVPNRGPGTNF